jgi:hypothetical protein
LLVYWILFAYFAFGALLENKPQAAKPRASLLLLFGAMLLAALIGFRYRVGADWFPYARMFDYAGRVGLTRVVLLEDPGYQLVNWTVQRLDFDLWAVNLVCGAIFAWGLLRFCRGQPLPWLAFLLAIPYLGIVVAMGYSRQAVAIGIILAGLAALQRGASVLRFAGYVAIACMFHRTAIIVLPLVIFADRRTRLLNVIAGVAVAISAYDLFLANSVGQLFRSYLGSELSSQGATIRVALVSIPALIFLLNRRRFAFPDRDDRIWRNFAIASLVSLVALMFVSSSTAVDRVTLYFLPLELVILSRVPIAFRAPIVARTSLILLSASIQWVWLNYAQHAQFWLPYRFFPVGT